MVKKRTARTSEAMHLAQPITRALTSYLLSTTAPDPYPL